MKEALLVAVFAGIAGVIVSARVLVKAFRVGSIQIKALALVMLAGPIAALVASFMLQGVRGPYFLVAVFGCFAGGVIALFDGSRPAGSGRNPNAGVGIMKEGSVPEVSFDPNARMTDNGYLLTHGALADLAKLGLTPETAVGKRFTFNGGADTDDHGHPADIMIDGTIERDEKFGYLAVADSKGVYWKSRT